MGNMLGGLLWELQGEMGELSLKAQYVHSWNLQRITKNTVRKKYSLGEKKYSYLSMPRFWVIFVDPLSL